MIIDSGAGCNFINRNLWELLKANEVERVSSKAAKKLYSYGSKQPLHVAFKDICMDNKIILLLFFLLFRPSNISKRGGM